MNKYYFHFGDYYNDGHGRFETVCVESPCTREEIQDIINKIDFKHPSFNNWKCGLATRYEKSRIEQIAWDEILALGYPIQRFIETNNDINFNFSSWEELQEKYTLPELDVTIDTVIDIYLFVLNYYGANVTPIPIDTSNHFSFGYGYGCFY